MKVFYFHFYGTSKPISYSQATEKTSDPKNVISNNPDLRRLIRSFTSLKLQLGPKLRL